ncbi:MAG: hypothetical protein GF410_16450 [Chitinivibrionales bacterium]|nr:hypothetical protein [Chitinivibrionales bacterium]
MKRQRPDRVRRRAARGVTVLELMVAVTLGTVLVSMVYLAWSTIHGKAVRDRRADLFHSEALRLTTSISGQLRRSPRLLGWHGYGLSFVSAGTGDTLSYEWYGGKLLRNDTAIVLQSQASWVEQFDVSIEEEGWGPAGPLFLLRLAIAVKDSFDNETRIPSCVAVALPSGSGGETEAISPWNF